MDDDAFLAFRRQTYAQLRRASDRVRNEFIPDFAARGAPTREAFYAINRGYFVDDVLRGQMVSESDAKSFAADGAKDPFYVTALDDLGGPPAGRGNAGGFETLHPRFAEAVVARTFAALDAAGPFEDEEAFLRVLTLVDFLLQVAHFAKDGSGRSGEDLLVLLGERHGTPLTFSITGYRGAIEGPGRLMSLRHATQKIAQVEISRNFFGSLGLSPPEATPTHIRDLLESLVRVGRAAGSGTRQARLTWPDGLGGTIEEIFAPLAPGDDGGDPDLARTHPYRLYASFLAREAIYLTLCLAEPERLTPGLCARYPLSMACRARDLRGARRHAYLAVPARAAEAADEAVARLELVRRGKLAHEDAELARLLEQLAHPAPRLADLIAAERDFAPLEALLGRLRLSVTPAVTAEEVRQAVLRDLKIVPESGTGTSRPSSSPCFW